MLPEHSVQLHSEVPPNQTGIFKNVLIPPFHDSCLEAQGVTQKSQLIQLLAAVVRHTPHLPFRFC